jgi:ATP-binding cassette, subfamily B (MDR/TAP), member 7
VSAFRARFDCNGLVCTVQQPSLLIFDEATSALDSTTERSILQSLQELATGRTALFVAHRLSTAAQCDQIVVLEKGKVVESGSHSELLKLGGRYATLWSDQATVDDLDAAGLKSSTLPSDQ